jgi:hypothetical protein
MVKSACTHTSCTISAVFQLTSVLCSRRRNSGGGEEEEEAARVHPQTNHVNAALKPQASAEVLNACLNAVGTASGAEENCVPLAVATQ